MIQTQRIPPGPKGHWLSGSLPEFRRERLGFMVDLAREFGDVANFRLAHRSVYLLSDPHHFEEVLVQQNASFIKHFALRLNPLVLGKGLLTSEGEFWLKQRRLIQPAFLKQKIAAYGPIMTQAAERLMETWKPGEKRDIQVEMMKLTLEIAAKTLFDAEVGGGAQVIVEAMQVMQDHFLRRSNSILPMPLWVPTPNNRRFRRSLKRLDEILFGFIRQRRQHPVERNDLLSILLAARDVDGSGMTDHQLRDEAMTLFLAGHETTALAMSWTWYLLGQHPRVEKKLQAEWSEVLKGRVPAAEDWGRLPYTESVLQESMRLYPPAYVIGREATKDVEIAGYFVPKETTVMMSQWVVHHDARWFPNPSEFRPERWQEDAIKKLPKFAYFPFGGGPRICIGNLFAMMEMVLVLATIGQRFRFALQPGIKVSPQATFTLRPDPGVPGIILPRS